MPSDRATVERDTPGRWRERALSFGSLAESYDATRPSYPGELLELFASWSPAAVADVGAGTGKLTRLLVSRGFSVTAVEPDPDMRAVLKRSVPSATVVDGRGEALPLADGAVDLVTFAQAWHWVDEAAAVPEVHRVLTQGGRLALVWNLADDTEWQAAVQALTASGGRVSELREPPPFEGFAAPEQTRLPWVEELSVEDYLARASTWSGVSTLPQEARAELLARLRELLASHPQTAGRDTLEVNHVTVVVAYRAG